MDLPDVLALVLLGLFVAVIAMAIYAVLTAGR